MENKDMFKETTPTVLGLVEQGYGVIHALADFHPDGNSPISKDGQSLRTRMVAGLNPSLSTSTFKEGSPSMGLFGEGSLSLLASGGSITSASATDNSTKASASTGARLPIGRTTSLTPTPEELASALARKVGYNEVVVDNFTPAAVVVHLDDALSKMMINQGILRRGEGGGYFTDEETIAQVQSVIKGDVSLLSIDGQKPLVGQKPWVDFVRDAACLFQRAVDEASMTGEPSLPIYGIINGEFYKFEGLSAGHGDIMKKASEKTGKEITRGALDIEWLRALDKHDALKDQISGPDKTLQERIAPFIKLGKAPTPLSRVVAEAPVFSQQEKAAMTLSVFHGYKDDYRRIPESKLEQWAPTNLDKRIARQAAIKLPKIEGHSLPAIGEDPTHFIAACVYRTQAKTTSNVTFYGRGLNDHLRAVEETNSLNQPFLDFMRSNERAIPDVIYAAGSGAHMDSDIDNGFNACYRESHTSQHLFKMTRERMNKFGPDGVIVVDQSRTAHGWGSDSKDDFSGGGGGSKHLAIGTVEAGHSGQPMVQFEQEPKSLNIGPMADMASKLAAKRAKTERDATPKFTL